MRSSHSGSAEMGRHRGSEKMGHNSGSAKRSRRSGPIKVGLLGGGQLARMLALKGHEMGLEVSVLSPSAQDPAAQVCGRWQQGDSARPEDLKQFLQQVDVATFESEFVRASSLNSLSPSLRRKLSPKPELMIQLQDRLSQKNLLLQHKLPTAPFESPQSREQAAEALKEFGGRMILKKRLFGYDGYGTFAIKKARDLQSIPAPVFSDPGLIAESWVPFDRELALLSVRNVRGQVQHFPLVESHQVDKRCLWVRGPMPPKRPQALQSLKRGIARFLDSIDYVGVMAFELFEVQGSLMINEIAPRVHNSAHYSLNALTLDQFSAHWRALLNWELNRPQSLYPGFAMLNLLGQSRQAPSWKPLPQDISLHWYGKTENRPGRKMGHINAGGRSAQRALNRLFKVRKDFQL